MVGRSKGRRANPPTGSTSIIPPAHEERQGEPASSLERSTIGTATPADLTSMTNEELEQRARELEAQLHRKALLKQVATLQAQVDQEDLTQDTAQEQVLSASTSNRDESRGRNRERCSSDSSGSDEHRERKKSRYITTAKPELYRWRSRRELTEFYRESKYYLLYHGCSSDSQLIVVTRGQQTGQR